MNQNYQLNRDGFMMAAHIAQLQRMLAIVGYAPGSPEFLELWKRAHAEQRTQQMRDFAAFLEQLPPAERDRITKGAETARGARVEGTIYPVRRDSWLPGLTPKDADIKYNEDGTIKSILVQRPPEGFRSAEMAWLAAHREEYRGRWVVIEEDRLIAEGDNGKSAYDQARAAGVDVPFLVHIPKEDVPFGGW